MYHLLTMSSRITSRISRLILTLLVYFSLLLCDASGETLCSVATVAEAGENYSALRIKTLSAFRAECRPRRRAWSFFTDPLSPREFTFILEPFSMPFRLNFTVKTWSDAWLALAEEKTQGSVFADINIGGGHNARTAIRGCVPCWETLVFYDESGLVSGEKSRPFWIDYKGGVVTVGKGGQEEGFIEWDAGAYHGRIPAQVHVGIASWEVNPGEWVFFQNCQTKRM